jgi:hypothetical protein
MSLIFHSMLLLNSRITFGHIINARCVIAINQLNNTEDKIQWPNTSYMRATFCWVYTLLPGIVVGWLVGWLVMLRWRAGNTLYWLLLLANEGPWTTSHTVVVGYARFWGTLGIIRSDVGRLHQWVILLLLQRSLLTGGFFCVPHTVRCQLGHWIEESITSYSHVSHLDGVFILLFATWHRHQVQGTSVLRLIRRTRVQQRDGFKIHVILSLKYYRY